MSDMFFTFIYADNHWHDLHELMPGGQAETNAKIRKNVKITLI